MNGSSDTIVIDPRELIPSLLVITLAMTSIYVALLVVRALTGHGYMYGLFPLFDLGAEKNLPTCFSGGLLFFNAILFGLITGASSRLTTRATWLGLTLVFLFLTYDELFCVHERITTPLRVALDASGVFYYAWIVVYVPVSAILAFAFLPTWRRLDRATRFGFGGALGLYFAGAVGFEMLGGAYEQAFGTHTDLGYGLLVAAEEALEMLGLVALSDTLLKLLRQSTPATLAVTGARPATSRAVKTGLIEGRLPGVVEIADLRASMKATPPDATRILQ